jgi:formylmethanofuran dehydrogenase subunit B
MERRYNPRMAASPTTTQQGKAGAGVSACPFCGLLCEDADARPAPAGGVAVSTRICELGRAGYARQSADGIGSPLLAGKPATLQEAVDAAARILDGAARPLFGGLATDVAGMRAAVELADRCGALLDHANSGAKFRNLQAFQDRGAITTTLSEVRNRADLFVVVGSDIGRRFPRFFERTAAPLQTLFGLKNEDRRTIFIGGKPAADAPGPAESIACDTADLPDVLSALSALAAGAPLAAARAGAVPMDTLRSVAQRMAAARYGVLAWAAADLDLPHAELAVLAINRLLITLNRTTRFSAVPLAGTEADLTADAVLLWQVGFPYRTSFASGHAEYDPYLHDARRIVARRELDAVLWVSTLSDLEPPAAAGAPLVLLAGPASAYARRADVFIPVGTPTLDHGSHLVRTDKVVTLRIGAARPATLPSAATVLRSILEAVKPC